MRLKFQQVAFVALLGIPALALADGIRDLPDIYATPIPTEIRRNFDDALHLLETCPECPLGVLDGDQFLNVYTKKFLVLGLEPHSFGGVWVVIALEGESRNAFRLWLYGIADDEYDLRSIEELPEFLDDELIQQLASSAYRQYWL